MAETNQILKLAAIIRKVDGNHSKGAAALAESILDHPDFRAALGEADEPAVPEGREPVSVTGQPSDEELYDYWISTSPEFGCADPVGYARAVLACWGNLAPQPPTEGEVAELVQDLHHAAEVDEWDGASPEWCQSMLRAADLLQRLSPPQPVPVSERLPEPNTKVLAHYFNDLGNGRTICAIWVPAKTQTDSYGEDDFTEYDEETDNFYWPEGWYEAIENWDDLGWVKVNEGKVVYWQPLPKWPAHALPLSGQEAV